jgi:hypothetical protein
MKRSIYAVLLIAFATATANAQAPPTISAAKRVGRSNPGQHPREQCDNHPLV